ncbi:hypothetical protein CYFUS_000248 [Cystobacter fuscus]|uniref:Uncharacterized protein n=1 Tax=Cystobacter fuscus TaxID=43 RepID=A0A250IUK9_9BACT|nr:hypothetical protein CYFUS_000248 [Cystobacter fuscus]
MNSAACRLIPDRSARSEKASTMPSAFSDSSRANACFTWNLGNPRATRLLRSPARTPSRKSADNRDSTSANRPSWGTRTSMRKAAPLYGSATASKSASSWSGTEIVALIISTCRVPPSSVWNGASRVPPSKGSCHAPLK